MTRTATSIIIGIIIVAAVAGLLIAGNQQATPSSPAAATASDQPAAVLPAASSTAVTAVTVPVVTTLRAVRIATTTAIVRGTIQPNDSVVTYWFEYSSDPRLGAVLIRTTPHIALSTTTGEVSVEVEVSDLMSSTTYYFRLVARNIASIVRGDPLSFRTK